MGRSVQDRVVTVRLNTQYPQSLNWDQTELSVPAIFQLSFFFYYQRLKMSEVRTED